MLFRSINTADTVSAYKSLARVERAFRCIKTVDLEIRPVYHWASPRVRAHVLLCMLTYYVEWHMRQALAPMLFDDDDPAAAEAQHRSLVAPAQRSPAAHRKASSQRAADHTRHDRENRILPSTKDRVPFDVITTPPHYSNAPTICSASAIACSQ